MTKRALNQRHSSLALFFEFQKDENGHADFKTVLAAFDNEDFDEEAMEACKMVDRDGNGKFSKEEFIRLASKSRGSSYSLS